MTVLALPDNVFKIIKIRPEILSEVAECIVLFGLDRTHQVCLASWGMSPSDIESLYTLPAFTNELEGIRKEVAADPNALIRMKAKRLFMDNLEDVSLDILGDTEASPSEKVSVMRMLKDVSGITDAPPTANSGKSGIKVSINIGGMMTQGTVIEGTAVDISHE